MHTPLDAAGDTSHLEDSASELSDEEAIAELTEQFRRYLEGEQDTFPELLIYKERRDREKEWTAPL